MRQTLIPGGPISRIAVMRSPERRTLAVMLSRDRLTEIASKPVLRPIASIHSRVRVAVLPARIIMAPKPSSTSMASLDAAAPVRTSSFGVEGMRLPTRDDARTLARWPREWQVDRQPRDQADWILIQIKRARISL